MHYKIILPLFILAIGFTACKSDGNQATTVVDKYAEAKAAYEKSPSKLTASTFVKELMTKLNGENTGFAKRGKLLDYGYKVAKDHGMTGQASGFLFTYLKENPRDSSPDKLFDLGKLMKDQNKPAAANILFQGLADKHADFGKLKEATEAITEKFQSADGYLMTLGENLFKDTDNTGINKAAAMTYVDACEAYALSYPNKKESPDNLFKAAEVAKSIRTFPKSLAIYDWILERYPNYEKTPTALFLKGFIIENNMKDDEKAREIYNTFLAVYPKHDLADDVQFLIENLGKTDQEILEMIEEKRKEKEAAGK